MIVAEGGRGAYRGFGEIVKRGEYVCGALRCHFGMARSAMMTFFSAGKYQILKQRRCTLRELDIQGLMCKKDVVGSRATDDGGSC